MWRWGVVVLVGCGGDPQVHDDARGADSSPDTGAELCAVCATDDDCASGTCFLYGDGWRKCTASCEAGMEALQTCAAPALGRCNGMGYCMCMPRSIPPDAGVPSDAPEAPTDGPQMDAAIIPTDAQ